MSAILRARRLLFTSLFIVLLSSCFAGAVHGSSLNLRLTSDPASSTDPYICGYLDQSNLSIVWVDGRTGNGDVYFNQIDSQGNRLHAADIRISEAGSAASVPACAVDANGNTYIVWMEGDPAYYAKLDSDGDTVRAPFPIASGFVSQPHIDVESDGRGHLAWAKEASFGYQEVWYRTFDSNGDVIAGCAAQRLDRYIAGATTNFPYVEAPSTEDPRAAVSWHRRIFGYDTDSLYLSYALTCSVIDGPSEQVDGLEVRRSAISNHLGGEPPTTFFEGVQGGTWHVSWLLGTDSYVTIDEGVGPAVNPALATMDEDVMLVWEDRGSGTPQIYSQSIDGSAGDLVGGNCLVSEGVSSSRRPSIARAGSSGFAVVWDDDRDGQNEIYLSIRDLECLPPGPVPAGWRGSPIQSSCTGPEGWEQPGFGDSTWDELTLPDAGSFDGAGTDRFYRGRFVLPELATDLHLLLRCDDGCEVHLNGHEVGEFGAGPCHTPGCVNLPDCTSGGNSCVAPIPLDPTLLVSGVNALAIHVSNGADASYFSADLLRGNPGVCGDCAIQFDEECDPTVAGGECDWLIDCGLPGTAEGCTCVVICGDGTVDQGEECDDGNQTNGDGCDDDSVNGGNCTLTSCGNEVVTAGEECDDGNHVNGDGCDDDPANQGNCTFTRCGNGVVTDGETCDEGNQTNGDGCDDDPGNGGNCTFTSCGNGVTTIGEQCDDGNLFDGDGCSSSCEAEPLEFEWSVQQSAVMGANYDITVRVTNTSGVSYPVRLWLNEDIAGSPFAYRDWEPGVQTVIGLDDGEYCGHEGGPPCGSSGPIFETTVESGGTTFTFHVNNRWNWIEPWNAERLHDAFRDAFFAVLEAGGGLLELITWNISVLTTIGDVLMQVPEVEYLHTGAGMPAADALSTTLRVSVWKELTFYSSFGTAAMAGNATTSGVYFLQSVFILNYYAYEMFVVEAVLIAATEVLYTVAVDPQPEYLELAVPLPVEIPTECIPADSEGQLVDLFTLSSELLGYLGAMRDSYIRLDAAEDAGATEAMAIHVAAARSYTEQANLLFLDLESRIAGFISETPAPTSEDIDQARQQLEESGLPELERCVLSALGFDSEEIEGIGRATVGYFDELFVKPHDLPVMIGAMPEILSAASEGADQPDGFAIADVECPTVSCGLGCDDAAASLTPHDDALLCYVELPSGPSVDQIMDGFISIGFGESAPGTTLAIGDHDQDGEPDLAVEFDCTSVLADLECGTQGVAVSGSLQDGTRYTGVGLLTIAHVEGPDLSVESIDTSSVDGDWQALEITGSVAARISNPGGTDVTMPFIVTAFEDLNLSTAFEPSEDRVLGTAQMVGLSADSSELVEIEVSGPVVFRENPVWVFVDSNAEIVEVNEDNNLLSSSLGCQVDLPPGALEPVLEWSWTSSTVQPNALNVMMTPGVMDLDGDGVPEVIFASTASTGGGAVEVGWLRALRGADGTEMFTVTDSDLRINTASSVAVGDLDLDGSPEIVACDTTGRRLMVFEHDGTFKWRSPYLESINWGAPSIADLDGDGTPEIVIGRQALDNQGNILWTGTGGRGVQGGGPLSLVADVNLDGRPDVVAGNTVYNFDGTTQWQAALGDGFNAVANFDSDPYPEIVHIRNGSVRLLEHDGSLACGPTSIPGGGAGGPPTVADYDADGQAEIGVAGSYRYAVFESDCSLKWSAVTQDRSSNRTGSSVFDFDGDGSAEVVYRDERRLRVYRGTDGNVLFSVPMSSCTWLEYVMVADVDADGNAEIVAVANNNCGYGPQRGVYVYGDANDNWVPTRPVWNQHTYHVTNINENGSVPVVEQSNWLFPANSPLNNYRQNVLTGAPQNSAPDLTASHIQCVGSIDGVTITARTGNAGAVIVGAGLPVSFYDGDPGAGGILLGTVTTTVGLRPGEFEDVAITVLGGVTPGAEVYAVADDYGYLVGSENECDESNNTHHTDACNRSPIVECLDLVTTNDPGECGAVVACDAIASCVDPDGDAVILTCEPPGPYAVDTSPVEVTCSDGWQHVVVNCNMSVEDTEYPIVTCPSDTTPECPANTDPLVNGLAYATDNCVDPSIRFTDTHVPGCGDTETITRRWAATDDADNSDTCIQVISVVDTTPPTIMLPTPLLLECSSAGGVLGDDEQIVSWLSSATASDTCGNVALGNDAPAFFPVESTVISFVAVDDCGNPYSDDSIVSVVDTTGPALVVPADITVECAGAYGTAIDIGTATASDVCCSEITISNDAPPAFPLGETVVTWDATDCNGNSSSGTHLVTVVDKEAPELAVFLDPARLWPPNHQMVNIVATQVSSDVCSEPTIRLISVESSEPDNATGMGDGDTVNDIQGVELGTADYEFELRAERAGSGGGRTYTATYSATDASGNRSEAQATVFVPHDQGGRPVIETDAPSSGGIATFAGDLSTGIGIKPGSSSQPASESGGELRMRRGDTEGARALQAPNKTREQGGEAIEPSTLRSGDMRSSSTGGEATELAVAIDRRLAIVADTSASQEARVRSIGALLTALGVEYDLGTRVRIAKGLVGKIDVAMNAILADHLLAIQHEADRLGREDVSQVAAQLLKDLAVAKE